MLSQAGRDERSFRFPDCLTGYRIRGWRRVVEGAGCRYFGRGAALTVARFSAGLPGETVLRQAQDERGLGCGPHPRPLSQGERGAALRWGYPMGETLAQGVLVGVQKAVGESWARGGIARGTTPHPLVGEGAFRYPPAVSRVPTLICHGEEHSDVAISIRL